MNEKTDVHIGFFHSYNKETKRINNQFLNNLIFFISIRFPAILLIKTIESYLHEFCERGILHSDFR